MQNYCRHLTDIGEDYGALTLPVTVCPKDITDRTMEALAQFKTALYKVNRNERLVKALDSVEKRIKLSGGHDEVGRQALYQLPHALAKLAFLVGKRMDKGGELAASCAKLVEAVLGCMVEYASTRLPEGRFSLPRERQPAFKVIGEGSGYWVLKEASSDVVALVSKSDEPDGFTRLRQRWDVGRTLKRLHQPYGLLLATTPFLHLFSTYAPGVRLWQLYENCKAHKSDTTRAELIAASRAAGAMMRKISEIKTEGVGELVRSKDGVWRGADTHPEDFFKSQEHILARACNKTVLSNRLERIGVSEEEFNWIAGWYQSIYKGQERRCLCHPDPHMGNFIYDTARRNISILDWERACIVPEPVMLARVFQFWSTCSSTGKLGTQLFDEFMNGYEPNNEKRSSLVEVTLKAAAVTYLVYISSVAATLSREPATTLEDPRRKSLFEGSKHRLRAILDLGSSWKGVSDIELQT